MAYRAIVIEEILRRTIIVDNASDDLYEDINKVSDAVDRCDIILDADDFTERNYYPASFGENGIMSDEIAKVSRLPHLKEK